MDGQVEKILELTAQMIRNRAYTAHGANANAELAAEYLSKNGLAVEIIENNGHKMVISKLGSGSGVLILNGHLDVVEGREEQYEPYVEGDRFFGRGTYDMLASCAVMLVLMTELAKNPPHIRVCLTLSTTEETDGEACTGYMLDHGVTGDFGICGEPTNLAVSVMSKGVFRFRSNIRGHAAHSSRPWQGENALLKAVDIYRKIEQLPFAKRSNAYFEQASVNLSRLSGGTVMNQVPEDAEMVIDIRYLPGEDTNAMLQEIKALDQDMKLDLMLCKPAVVIEEDDVLLNCLTDAVAEASNRDCVRIGQHGAADTMFFQEHGIPSVEFGPCGYGHHGPQEYVEISSLPIYMNCIKGMIRKMEALPND